MKFIQRKPSYEPISIVFQTEKEATVFFNLIDEIDNITKSTLFRPLTADENALVILISNARTNGEIVI